jgi:hypothetical protein
MAPVKKQPADPKRTAAKGLIAAKRRARIRRTPPVDLDRLFGKLPDDRSAEEILADLDAMKYGRSPR